jgi:hypothetical protein
VHQEKLEELQTVVTSLTEKETHLQVENTQLRTSQQSVEERVELAVEEVKVTEVKVTEVKAAEVKVNEVILQDFAEASVQYSQVLEEPALNLLGIFVNSVTRMKLSTKVIRLTSKGKEHERSLRIDPSEAAVHTLESAKTADELVGVKAAFASCVLWWTTKSLFKRSSACLVTIEAISSITHTKDSAVFRRARTSTLPGLSIYYASQGEQKCLDLLFSDFSMYKIWSVGLEMLLFAARGTKLEEANLEQLQIHREAMRSP